MWWWTRVKVRWLHVVACNTTNAVSIVVIETCWCRTCGKMDVGSSEGLECSQNYFPILALVNWPSECVGYVPTHLSASDSPLIPLKCLRVLLVRTKRSQPHLLFYFHYPYLLLLPLRGVTQGLGSCRFCSVWNINKIWN